MSFIAGTAYVGVGNIVGRRAIADPLQTDCSYFTFKPTSVEIASKTRTSWVFDLGKPTHVCQCLTISVLDNIVKFPFKEKNTPSGRQL